MSSKTVNALWDEYKPRRVRGKSSEPETTRLYERYVAPVLGSRRVDKIGLQDIEDFHASFKETPYQANRILALLRPMFKYAGPDGLKWMDGNPAKGVKMFGERKRRRHLKPSEAPRIANCIRDKEPTAPAACLFLWLLIFTGARPKEIKTARWCDIIDDEIILDKHKSAERSGIDRNISLPPAAIDAMNRLIPVSQRDPNGKIIPIGTPEYIWRTVRVDAKCPDLRVYDLRHTFGTYALELGFTLDQIGEALCHSDPKTTKIYAELTDRSRKRIAIDTSCAILHDMGVAEMSPIERKALQALS